MAPNAILYDPDTKAPMGLTASRVTEVTLEQIDFNCWWLKVKGEAGQPAFSLSLTSMRPITLEIEH